MKPTKKYLLTLLMLCLFGSTTIVNSGCCDVLAGCDLLLDFFDTTQAGQTNTGGIIYDISQTVLNSVKGLKCTGDENEAGPHKDKNKIYYSADGDFSNPSTVADKTFDIDETTNPGKKYTIINNIEFAVDGYYSLIGDLDVTRQLTERDTTNNDFQQSVGKNAYYPNVIHITGTGNKFPPIGKDGQPIYINNWTGKIVYHD